MPNALAAFSVKHALFCCAIFLISACARQGAPTGGPLDTTPPKVVEAASTPNYATRFDQRRIELSFDEWVTLSDAITQIVVSPPLAKRPDVALKGKKVIFSFDKDEVLRPNTTYTINFGSSVKDFREGNPARDLRFVFSTGEHIDSLGFKGTVVDAFTGQAVENVSVMLYDNLADSALRKERPYYFAKTDKNGQFEFQNLREGDFRAVAVEDADQNLRWDGENERIAFLDSTLRLGDSALADVSMRLFKNRPAFRLTGVQTGRYGLLRLGFNTPLDTFDYQVLAPENLRLLPEKHADSLLFWYDLPEPETDWSLVFAAPGADKPDTVMVKNNQRSEFIKNKRIFYADVALPPAPPPSSKQKNVTAPASSAPKKQDPIAAKTIVQVHSKPAFLPFNVPISAFDTSLVELLLDSLAQKNYELAIRFDTPKRAQLSFAWKQGASHTLRLLPGAVTDFWGQSNTDTLVRIFNVPQEKQLGALTVKLEKLRPGIPYLFQLMNGNTVEEAQRFVADKAEAKLIFKDLQLATYSGRLVEDLNGNGRWDTGHLPSRSQPERVFAKTFDALRPNWEVEASLSAEPVKELNAKKSKG
jgi:hypothetical protein